MGSVPAHTMGAFAVGMGMVWFSDLQVTCTKPYQLYCTMVGGFVQILKKHGTIQPDGCNDIILSVSLIFPSSLTACVLTLVHQRGQALHHCINRATFTQEAITKGVIAKTTAEGKSTEVFYNPGCLFKAPANRMVIVDGQGMQVEYLEMYNTPVYIPIMDLTKHNHNDGNIRLLQEWESGQKWNPTEDITNAENYIKDC